MTGPRITMIGAGSVVFARTLMSDILSLPKLDARRLHPAAVMAR